MTKRNIDLLSNRDMFVKYANVVEVARNAKIKIYHQGGVNCVYYKGIKDGKHQFKIYSATPNAKGIEKFVGIIHELSHVLFQSPFNATNKLLEEHWELEGERLKLFFNVFNVLEDQRIESQMGKMYLKHAGRFNKTTKKLGRLMDVKSLTNGNPVNMLLAIRFQRGNDIKELKNFDVYEKALQDVVLTDKYGALRVLVILKPYIDKWMSDKEKKLESVVVSNKDDAVMKKLNADTFETDKTYSENQKESSGETDLDIPEELLHPEDEVNKETGLEVSKKNGSDIVNEIFKSLRDDGTVKNPPKNVEYIDRHPELVSINLKTAKGMSKIFKILMMRSKEFVDYDGDEIDVESYVEGIIRGNDMGRCRLNKKQTHGVSIVVSIDGSYSMSGSKILIAREMVATMFESVKHLDNVDIRSNIWSGNIYGKIGITEINSQEDVKYIGLNVKGTAYNTTPTHIALDHSSLMLKQMKGDRKLLIIITDGAPNHYNAGYHVSIESYIKTCKKSLFKAMNVTPNIMCVVVQDNRYFKYNSIRALFKPSKMMNVSNMGEASERVIKRFKRMIINNIV